MKTSAKLYQVILTTTIVLLSMVTFAQSNGNIENPFSHNPFRSIRSDANKYIDLADPVTVDLPTVTNNETNYSTDGEYIGIGQEKVYTDDDKAAVESKDNFSAKNLYNYPNPFSESTMISFEVGTKSSVTLSVYYKRMLVTILVDSRLDAGEYSVVFNSGKLPAGTYKAVVTVDGKMYSRDMFKAK